MQEYQTFTDDFSLVAAALGGGMANISVEQDEELAEFLADHQKKGPIISLATHSRGGRYRTLRIPARDVLVFDDPCFSGGWEILSEKDIISVEVISATSGSSISAVVDEEGIWVLTLRVPLVNDAPYQGSYYETFHAALAGLPMQEKQLIRCISCGAFCPLSVREEPYTGYQEISPKTSTCGACHEAASYEGKE